MKRMRADLALENLAIKDVLWRSAYYKPTATQMMRACRRCVGL